MNDSNLMEALERINEIHGHMAKGEIYRGFRPLPVAISGSGGLLAAYLQPHFVNAQDPRSFVIYWLASAILCAAMAGPFLPLQILRQSVYERRRTLHVWGQFLPCLVAGAMVALGISYAQPQAIDLLPGLWAVLFSLGVFSCRPFLPRCTGWVALFYMVAGAWMLQHPNPVHQPAWPLALTFCVGQLGGAIMLYCNRERTTYDA